MTGAERRVAAMLPLISNGSRLCTRFSGPLSLSPQSRTAPSLPISSVPALLHHPSLPDRSSPQPGLPTAMSPEPSAWCP